MGVFVPVHPNALSISFAVEPGCLRSFCVRDKYKCGGNCTRILTFRKAGALGEVEATSQA
jgi:hypothetical protein